MQLASSLDAVVEFEVVVGDFVPTGSRLATVSAASGPPDTETLCRLVHIGAVRTLNQDPAYGFRLLADVGVRALSPAVNDPTTAVQTLDQLDDLLHRLASRPLGNGEIVDGSGVTRVRYRAPNWEVFVSLALDEIRIAGASSLQVVRRLRALLADLAADVPAPRQAVVIERLQALDENVARFETPFDRRQAAMPDRQGIGQPSRASAVPGRREPVTARVNPWIRSPRLGEQLRFFPLELLVRRGLPGRGGRPMSKLVADVGGAGCVADIGLHRIILTLRRADGSLVHLAATDDQVDENAYVRQDQGQPAPRGPFPNPTGPGFGNTSM